eukprot:TRINITY_DN343_c0_g1_i1.p1 TRINITY_DN343_c0_g1~~TRINITY_DN343_c0_g1_i1.p1  ORF type:complete len:154 (-),score=31.72 TRINITY_DN343_c0_g1_i1:53-514(-)
MRVLLAVVAALALIGSAQAICRSAILPRAKVWIANHVPYSQTGSYQGYRTDCSGYVSMSWECPQPGYDTLEFQSLGIAHQITKDQLLPGDVMLAPGHHICLFAGWTDASKTQYTAYEEYDTAEGTISKIHPYPYSSYPGATFYPARFKDLQEC